MMAEVSPAVREPAASQLQIGSSTITYLEAGQGVPLVLLHGIGSAAWSFQDQLMALSARYRVIAWDAPGYGGSSCLADPVPKAADYAQAVAGFLDALKIERCHLLGHSLGCLMAASFARLYPQRLLSLTLSSIAVGQAHMLAEERQKLLDQRLQDVTVLSPREMAEKRGPRLLALAATPAMVRRVIDAMAAVRPDGYSQAARMLAGGDVKADIAAIPSDLSLQIIYGEADVITPPARNLEVAALRPQAPVRAIADAGHALYLEKPEAFNAAVRDFIG
ncbi:MAG: alpha/beta fold hydrolase [Alphaproteobacteria bacterium]|nr:alpha/beta fold hydrolase [Alphaproteobacteria bacterium]